MADNTENVNLLGTKKTSQGATRHCCYGPCNSDSRYKDREHMQGVWWIPFPKPTKEIAKCRRWVQACGRENFTVEKVSRWTYICSRHFVGGDGPTPENPDPIPAQVSQIPQKRKLEAPDVNNDSKKLILDASEGLMLLKESLTQSLHQVLQKRSMLQELKQESTMQSLNQGLVSPTESKNQVSLGHSLKQESTLQPLQQSATEQSLKHTSPEQSVNQVLETGTMNQASFTQPSNQVKQNPYILSLNQVSPPQPLDHQVSTTPSLNQVSPTYSLTQVSSAQPLNQLSPQHLLNQVSLIKSLKQEPPEEELNQKSSIESFKQTSQVQSVKQESTLQTQESPTQSFNHVSLLGSVNPEPSNGSLCQIAHVKSLRDEPSMLSSKPVSQIVTTNHVSQTGSFNHMSQIGSANHLSQIGSENHVSQIEPANHVSQIGSANHLSQIGSANHVSQIEPANHVSQIEPANHVSQIVPANHMSQIVPANHVLQIVPANHVSQIMPQMPQMVPANHVSHIVPVNHVSQIEPTNNMSQTVPANSTSQTMPANNVSQIGSEKEESPKGSELFMSANQVLFLHAWNQASRVQSRNEVLPIGSLKQEPSIQPSNCQALGESQEHSIEQQLNQELLRPSSVQLLPKQNSLKSSTFDQQQMPARSPDVRQRLPAQLERGRSRSETSESLRKEISSQKEHIQVYLETINNLVIEKSNLKEEVKDLTRRLKTSERRVSKLDSKLTWAIESLQNLKQNPTIEGLQAYQRHLQKEAGVQTFSKPVRSQEVQTSFLCSSALANKIYQTVNKSEVQKVQIKEDLDRIKQIDCFLYEKISKKGALFEFYTGLTVKQFDHLFSFVGPRVSKMPDIDGNGTSSKPEKKLCLQDQMFLMMMKLRHGFPNRDLAYRFGVSSNTVSCILNRWIEILHYQIMFLKKMFPSRELIRQNMPEYLQSFRKLRIVLNCLVILTEQPIDLSEDENMFLCDRYPETIKVVIGITPSGAVSFISDAYEGNVMEKDIVLNSGLIDLLEAGDLVVAEHDFFISEALQAKHCDLIKPPFVAKWEKLTPQKEIQIKNINRVRAHSERVIDRMKRFKIIGGILPHGLKPVISKVVHIVGFLVNYQPPFDD